MGVEINFHHNHVRKFQKMGWLQALQFKNFLKTTKMAAMAESIKRDGFKHTIRKYGWKVFVILFFAYLVRDVVIYILIPWWVGQAVLKQ